MTNTIFKINPSVNELRVLPDKGDLVNLVMLGNSGQEEPVWVEMTSQKGKVLTGRLKNQPVSTGIGIKAGEILEFGINNIFEVVTKKQIEKLIEKEKTKDRDLSQQAEAVLEVMEELIKIGSAKGEYLFVFKIKLKDRRFYKQYLKAARQAELKNITIVELTDINRLFLSLVYIIALPQIVNNTREYLDFETVQIDPVYRSQILEALALVKKRVKAIDESDPALLNEFCQRMTGLGNNDDKNGTRQKLTEEIEAAITLLEQFG